VRATNPDVVAAAGPQVFILIVATDPNANAPATVSNTASGLSGAADPNTNNNDATAQTTVNTAADLALTKADSPDPVFAGDNITYSITLTNHGPNPAQSVSLSDATPANTTFVSFTAPAAWTVTGQPAQGDTGPINATNPSVPSGATTVFTLVVKVNAN